MKTMKGLLLAFVVLSAAQSRGGEAETGVVFGRLATALDNAGRPSTHRVQDVWIAAFAVQHNLKVLTRNPKDFLGIPGLDVLVVP